MMPPALLIGASLLALVAAVQVGSARLMVPHSILLVLLGAVLSFVKALPTIAIDPELILLLFLPPLLYSSGVGMSWRGFRSNLRPILLLAIGCVLFTASAVAAVGHWVLGLPWAVGFVLGAVVSPPDAVAPMAIVRRLSVPSRLLTILEGEGLVNDATALILFSFAVAAVAEGHVSIVAAVGSFVVIVIGELAWGVAAGWAVLRLRGMVRNPPVEITLALLTPFLTFWLPHALGGSGVLATVAAGLYVSWNGPRFIRPATRLQGYFVWDLIIHLLDGVLFLLTGLQAREIARGLDGGWERLVIAGAIVSAVVILVRFIWVFSATYIPRRVSVPLRRRDPIPPWQQSFVVGFTGIRGVVSLAAALSIPLTVSSGPFPDRDLILFVTFCVIMVTLVGQGSALPWLVTRLGLARAGQAEAAAAKTNEVSARIAGIEAALDELSQLERRGAPPGRIATLWHRQQSRLAEYRGTADETVPGSPVADDAELQVKLIGAERRRIAQLYLDRRLSDEARRRIERELDLEDARNRHAMESATGNLLADPQMRDAL